MRNLLLKLKLIKMNQTEFYNKLTNLFDSLARTVIDESDLDDEISKLTECEIKILFWIYAAQILNEKLEHDLFDKIMSFIRNNIIFSSIDESRYTEKFIQTLIDERSEFYNIASQEIEMTSSYENYDYRVGVLWFDKPFQPIAEIAESKVLSFELNPFIEFNAQLRIKLFFSDLLPPTLKYLEGLIKILKKN